MSTANIYGFPNSKAHAPRNAFNLSRDVLFNSPAGMLLPGFVEEIKAGDKLKVSVKNFTRTDNVNTAAFMSFDQKMDFWFVPYRLIWSAYNQWRLGNTQARSTTSLQGVGGIDDLPCMPWSNFVITDSSSTSQLIFNAFDYRYKYGIGFASQMIRFLDLLGYGLVPLKDATKKNISADFTDAERTALRTYFTSLSGYVKFNYFRLAAYQCVYMHAYRNEDFEQLDSSYYNCDSLYITPSTYSKGLLSIYDTANKPVTYDVNVSSPYSLFHGLWANEKNPTMPTGSAYTINKNRLTLEKLFTPRFKNYRKDLFTTLKPSSGILSTGLHGGTSLGVAMPAVMVDPDIEGIPPFVNTPLGRLNNAPRLSDDAGDLIYSYQLRSLMALDKFARLAIYANKNYSSLYEALFGVKVDEPDVPRYLGSFSSNINISEVVATSSGSDGGSNPKTSVLGEISGKGTGGNQSFVFNDRFNEDGIVIGIHYIMPYNYFNPYKIDPFVLKCNRYDYYYPSFDGLGLSPVFAFEYSYWNGEGNSGTLSLYSSSILGFNTRYHEYKQRVNTVHGTFAYGQQDYDWTLTMNNEATTNPIYMMKIAPNCTDTIFGVNWNGTMSTDPFKCFYSFNVTKVSNMEAIGVPSV